jgi:hypothetical protein
MKQLMKQSTFKMLSMTDSLISWRRTEEDVDHDEQDEQSDDIEESDAQRA